MPNNPNTFDGARGPDGITPELEALHQRLLADGASWRRSLPSPDGMIRYARRVTGMAGELYTMSFETRREEGDEGTVETGPNTDALGTTPGHALSTPKAEERGHQAMNIRSARGVAAGAAALVVVTLLVVILHTFVASGTGAGAQVHGKWQTLSRLTMTTSDTLSSGVPAVAASDPNTVYETTLSPLKVRRTTDAGAHWTNLHVPGDTSGVEDIQVFVSPLDAQNVFLTLTTPAPSGASASCPAAPTAQSTTGSTAATASHAVPLAMTVPQSGRVPCSLQYYSNDGGNTWKPLTLPVQAVLVDTLPYLQPLTADILRPQGMRLYAAAGCGPMCGFAGDDIVSSADGGAHWTVADQSIRAAGYYICDFAPAPTGSDVYAVATTVGCNNESVPPLYLWHSGDAGAHWTLVGRMPTNASYGMAVVSTPSGKSLLYVQAPQATAQPHTIATVNGPDRLEVSADGGVTWQAAPASGVPSAAQPSSASGPLCVLSDGTVVEAFVNASQTSLYGWKQSDTAWRSVAPPLHGQLTALLAVPQNGEDELIAVTGGGLGQGVNQSAGTSPPPQNSQSAGTPVPPTPAGPQNSQGAGTQTGITYTVQSYLP